MADNKNVTFDGIMRDLRAGKYAPVYYLMGEEPYYIDKLTDFITENALKPEDKDFNLTVMYGSDVTGSQVADAARRYPMMAERQVVVVKEVQNLKNTDHIAAYLAKPAQTTVLVMCHKNGTIDRRKKLASMVEKHGVLFESKKLKDRDLPSFIEKYLRERGVGIDHKAQQIIADSIGSDLSRLTGELDKLQLGLPADNRQVTPETVEKQIGVSKDFNSFELRDAIVNRNVFKANQIINYFDSNPKAGSIYSFLPMIFNYFQNLMVAYYCPQKDRPESLAQWLELRSPWAAKDYMTGMRNFSATKVMQIIYMIREIDAKSKGVGNPNTPPGELMKELLFFILH